MKFILTEIKNKELCEYIKDVQESYTKMTGYKDLLDKCTNPNIVTMLGDNYSTHKANWELNIERIARYVLKDDFDPSANVSVNWILNKIEVEIDKSLINNEDPFINRFDSEPEFELIIED